METHRPSVMKHGAIFRRARAKAASEAPWRDAARTQSRGTQATIRTADKGATCRFLRGVGCTVRMSLASIASVGCQTEAAFPEIKVDLAKTGVSCERCCKFFFQKGSADRHWRLHHAVEPPEGPQEPYCCPYCSLSSYIRKFVQDHEGTHVEEEALALRCSAQSYPQNASPVIHAAEPTNDESPNVCRFCKKWFATKKYRRCHEKLHTREQTYPCQFCPQRFTHKSKRDLHKRSHVCEMPHVCDVCQKRFSHRGYLVAHAKLHTNVKPFKCEICQRCFSRRHQLSDHKKLHVKPKSAANLYSCSVCQQSFSHSSRLTAHKKLHTEPVANVFSCSICQKRLAHKSSLTAHEKLHVEPNVKTYSCSICEESFSRKGVLEAHERKAHTSVSEKPYVCLVCHETFPKKMGLLNHNCTLITTRMIAASIQSTSPSEPP